MIDIQAEKYSIIESLTKVNDRKLIQKVKEILVKHEQIVGFQSDGKAISKTELIERAKKSNLAIKEGRVKSLEQIRNESKNW